MIISDVDDVDVSKDRLGSDPAAPTVVDWDTVVGGGGVVACQSLLP